MIGARPGRRRASCRGAIGGTAERHLRRNAARARAADRAVAAPPVAIDQLAAMAQHPVVVQRQHDGNPPTLQVATRSVDRQVR